MQTGGYDPAYPMNPGMNPMAMPFQGGMGGMMPMGMPPGNPMPIPPMSMPNYNAGGGDLPTPIGGQWNQIAQQMAGPLFLPPGTPQGSGATTLNGPWNPVMPAHPNAFTTAGYHPPAPPHAAPPPVAQPTLLPPQLLPQGNPLLSNRMGVSGLSGGFNGARSTFRY
jgi:hypothetical protein